VLELLYLKEPLLTIELVEYTTISLLGRNVTDEVFENTLELTSPASFSPSPNIFPFTIYRV